MTLFSHDRLNVYRESISFAAWTNDLLEKIPRNSVMHNQLDRASTSVPLNIAEGNGKHTENDRCRYFDIAKASALECAACLDVLAARQSINVDEAEEGKRAPFQIVGMLIGLIRANSDRTV